MRQFDWDLTRGGHYGQRSCEPHLKAEHMAAPTNAANVKKALANSEPSTHGTPMPSGGVLDHLVGERHQLVRNFEAEGDAGGRARNGELCGPISHLLVIFRSRHRPSSTTTAQMVDWPQGSISRKPGGR